MPAIRLVFSPSGGGCNHVHITRASDSSVLETYEQAEFRKAMRASETPIMLQIKFTLLNSGLTLSTATPAEIRAAIESKNYIL